MLKLAEQRKGQHWVNKQLYRHNKQLEPAGGARLEHIVTRTQVIRANFSI